MKEILQEISVMPGVTGACIFDKKEGLLSKDLPSFLTEDLIQTVGIHLVRLLQMGTMAGLDIQSSHFRFDKYTVVGIPLQAGVVLLTICEAQVNCSLVSTTAVMLAADMREELRKGGGLASKSKASEEVVDIVLEEVVDIVLDESDDADMELLYEKIEQALAGAIGPVAGVVLADYLVKWKEDGPAVSVRVAELVKMLEEEIGDGELIKDFYKKVKNIL